MDVAVIVFLKGLERAKMWTVWKGWVNTDIQFRILLELALELEYVYFYRSDLGGV